MKRVKLSITSFSTNAPSQENLHVIKERGEETRTIA
ncbi:Protein of unknown function [Pyronema omphalodes CBS 100304]|uniref:Uncharacterized protein n=1 Tax=Pyronema omphalodes (strain CBS 100304) TaxID=1076935 RepID=U4L790_PYROM|nr:Protein of unknown function [Pyronema omphalodes CBS 100304]